MEKKLYNELRGMTLCFGVYSFLLLAVGIVIVDAEPTTHYEKIYLDVPSPETARASLQFLTSKPHIAGTAGDLEMAKYVRDYFVAEGIPSVEIQPVDVLLSNPISSALELIDVNSASGESNVVFKAALAEEVLETDTTSDTWYRNHTYNGYAPSGDVTAQFVYANFGRPEDFDDLETAGVSVEGTIVITRYGRCFRGLKAMNAQARGAVGVIIYSDPEQDGFVVGPTYPDGGWRPASGVQRGSVQFNSLCAGDPARAAADKSVEDICGFSEDELKPSIPVMPISYEDAEPFLRAIGGSVAPEGFQGGLAFTYTVGPSGPSKMVRLRVENEEHVGPVWNVIGMIPGTLPVGDDQPVVLGNHRDAWIFGAVDPNSGTSALIEVARGLGKLLKEGWQPLRTIVLCSWSGEELGMLGSTAWGEANEEGLLAYASAYLNVDSAVSGPLFRLKVTPSLVGLAAGAMAAIEDPNSGKTLFEAWNGDVQMLGSGSDYAVFLDYLGIATVDFEFQADLVAEYGVYHSVYDSFSWMREQGDPGFRYFQAAARLWGLMALRLANSAILPFDLTCQATALETYLAKLTDINANGAIDLKPLEAAVAKFRTAADSIASMAAAGPGNSYCGIANPNKEHKNGDQADAELTTMSVMELQQARNVALRSGVASNPRESKESKSLGTMVRGATAWVLNEKMAMTERHFLSKEGLPGRKWFRHVLQAPGLYLGYDAESFPGITQALDDGDEELAQAQVIVAAGCIDDAANFLSQ